MKKLLIAILAVAALANAKDIVIDYDKMIKSEYVTNEIVDIRPFCAEWNKQHPGSRCSNEDNYHARITYFKCPNILPRPLAVYHAKDGKALLTRMWATACSEKLGYSLHSVEGGGFEFIKDTGWNVTLRKVR